MRSHEHEPDTTGARWRAPLHMRAHARTHVSAKNSVEPRKSKELLREMPPVERGNRYLRFTQPVGSAGVAAGIEHTHRVARVRQMQPSRSQHPSQ